MMNMTGWDNGMMGMMGGGMIFGMLLMLALLVLAVLGIWALIVWLRREKSAGAATAGGGASRARELLEERYVRGELSTEEYRERLHELRGE
jgi:putative membrane protein